MEGNHKPVRPHLRRPLPARWGMNMMTTGERPIDSLALPRDGCRLKALPAPTGLLSSLLMMRLENCASHTNILTLSLGAWGACDTVTLFIGNAHFHIKTSVWACRRRPTSALNKAFGLSRKARPWPNMEHSGRPMGGATYPNGDMLTRIHHELAYQREHLYPGHSA